MKASQHLGTRLGFVAVALAVPFVTYSVLLSIFHALSVDVPGLSATRFVAIIVSAFAGVPFLHRVHRDCRRLSVTIVFVATLVPLLFMSPIFLAGIFGGDGP